MARGTRDQVGPRKAHVTGVEAKKSAKGQPSMSQRVTWGGDVNTSRIPYGTKTTKKTGRNTK